MNKKRQKHSWHCRL